MAFNSYDFLFLFLPATFIFYQLVRTITLKNIVLLTASYYFYIWGKPYLIIFIAISSLVDYTVGIQLGKTKAPNRRKFLLFLSLFVNLGMLIVFKYSHWFSVSFNNAMFSSGVDFEITPIHLPLPPGISFYTFQTLSYTFDVYRKKFEPHKNILSFCTYVAFFPQLIAGPIERSHNLLPQLSKLRPSVSLKEFGNGAFLIYWGLFKKIVFADNLGHLVNECLNRTQTIPGIAGLAIFAFAFQIYCDFSAYTDIARGSAKFFGIHLSRNFLTPYFAISPSDFWRRWHISLSTWLRDYLYIPLGGNQRGTVIGLRNLLITMFLGGLWHGAGLFFIVWGLYHGFLLIIYRLCPIDQFLVKHFKTAGHTLAVVLMFLLTCIGWAFFISSPSERFPMIASNLLQGFQTPFHFEIFSWIYPTFLFTAPIILTETLAYRRNCEFVDLFETMKVRSKVLLYVFMFYAICIFGKREAYDFIYFAF